MAEMGKHLWIGTCVRVRVFFGHGAAANIWWAVGNERWDEGGIYIYITPKEM
jgi:hypothetical protein